MQGPGSGRVGIYHAVYRLGFGSDGQEWRGDGFFYSRKVDWFGKAVGREVGYVGYNMWDIVCG